MDLSQSLYGSTEIIIILAAVLIISLYTFGRKAIAAIAGKKASTQSVLMLPSGNEHRNLIESPIHRDFYSAPVSIRRTRVFDSNNSMEK